MKVKSMAVWFAAVVLLTVVATTCAFSENYAAVANRKFAAKIYQELSKENGNVLISPASLQVVLGLLQMGAEGQTASELSQALSLPLNRDELYSTLMTLPKTLHSNPSVEIALASAVYARNDIKIAEAFKTYATNLGATVQPIQANYDAAVVDVNKWIHSVTRGLLENVLRPGDITIDTALLLINALYFKGRWRDSSFNEKDTEVAKFYRKSGTVPVRMMRRVDYLNIGRDHIRNATYLELPYEGDEYALIVVLPDDIDGLTRLSNNIELVLNNPPQFHEEQVDVRLPKFRATFEARLKPVLQRLGVKHAFGNADLSGFTADKRPLAVSDVVHNTLLDVNEQGTEAAAASAVGIVDRIFSQPIPFYADHPFLYILQHKPTGIILFIGHYIGA